MFCTLAVVCALKNIGFFSAVARKTVELTGSVRRAVIAVVAITFFGSMLIANDMALLTFLPLGYLVLQASGKERYAAVTFVLQNIAANLGGMLTPFGNPQNLYLYNKFRIPTGEFTAIMAVPFAAATCLILLCCILLIKNEPITVPKEEQPRLPIGKTVLYLILFALSIALVFRVIPYGVGLIVIPAVLIFADRTALKSVDYGLLFTFACFFVFSGNAARIDAIRTVLSEWMESHPLSISVLSCQVISNVPTAILLSEFTENYKALLYGVNIGGTGTLIASLASLITFRRYNACYPGNTGKYLRVFTALNLVFLIPLAALCAWLLAL